MKREHSLLISHFFSHFLSNFLGDFLSDFLSFDLLKLNRSRSLALLLLIFLAAACAPQQQNKLSSSDFHADGIIGGSDVLETDSFLQSSVGIIDLKLGQVICSGTLIAPNVVLTAAHCTANNFQSLAILFTNKFPQGTVTLQTENVVPVSAGITHPDWKAGNAIRGDLALLQIAGSAPAGYRPAALFTDTSGIPAGASAIVVGFGYTNADTKTRPAFLQKAELTIKTDHSSSTESVFDQTKGQGACSGDSGGPSFVWVKDQWLLFAVNSQTAAACTGRFGYLVVTRVASFQEWITKTLVKFQGTQPEP